MHLMHQCPNAPTEGFHTAVGLQKSPSCWPLLPSNSQRPEKQPISWPQYPINPRRPEKRPFSWPVNDSVARSIAHSTYASVAMLTLHPSCSTRIEAQASKGAPVVGTKHKSNIRIVCSGQLLAIVRKRPYQLHGACIPKTE